MGLHLFSPKRTDLGLKASSTSSSLFSTYFESSRVRCIVDGNDTVRPRSGRYRCNPPDNHGLRGGSARPPTSPWPRCRCRWGCRCTSRPWIGPCWWRPPRPRPSPTSCSRCDLAIPPYGTSHDSWLWGQLRCAHRQPDSRPPSWRRSGSWCRLTRASGRAIVRSTFREAVSRPCTIGRARFVWSAEAAEAVGRCSWVLLPRSPSYHTQECNLERRGERMLRVWRQ